MTNSRLKNNVRQRRETKRKQDLREVLNSTFKKQAVLLDELRWAVMGPHFVAGMAENTRRSLLNSFARTVREQLTNHVIEKLPISPRTTPVGLVARAAVYRMRDVNALRCFLSAKNAYILCRYKTNFDVYEPRYKPWSRYVTPQHHAVTFRFFESRPSKVTYEMLGHVPGTYIPATQKLSLIVPRAMTIDLASIAAVPWTLYGYDALDDWYKVDGTDPLSLVHRNRYQ